VWGCLRGGKSGDGIDLGCKNRTRRWILNVEVILNVRKILRAEQIADTPVREYIQDEG
jgi:hypothetical protein